LRHAAGRIAERRTRELRSPLDSVIAREVTGYAGSALADRQLQRRAWLRESLATLPHEQREIIALRIDGELTFAEIAAMLGISPNTAASRYRYALEKLRAAVFVERSQSE
jgi:RNA polymerase sigma-70 factor, ECF subfamily